MYYTVYEITNTINSKIYIGVHVTNNMSDSYMGSGTNLKKAFKKYGISNFKKEILFIFDNAKDMFLKEAEIVNSDFILREDTYNIVPGGGGAMPGTMVVKDENNIYFSVDVNDDRIKTGELITNFNNKIMTINENGNHELVNKNDTRLISGEIHHNLKNMTTVKDKFGNIKSMNIDDPRIKSGEYFGITKGFVSARDKNDKILFVSVTDPRWETGEIIGVHVGKVRVKNKNGKMFSVDVNDDRIKTGELSYINSGKKYIHNKKLNKRKMVPENDIQSYIIDGWELGMK